MCIDRRHFVKAGLGAIAATAIPGRNVLALGGLKEHRASSRLNHRVIMINMRGGWDSLSVFPPHGLNEYYNLRPTLAMAAPDPTDPTSALPAEPGVGISYLMPELHAAYQAGEVVVLQKTGYPSPDLSHFTSQDVMSKGIRDGSHPDTRGWLGRLGDLYFTDTIKIVGVGTGNKLDFIGDAFRPVIVDSLDALTIGVDSASLSDSEFRNLKTEEILNETGPLIGLKAQVKSASTSAFALAEQVSSAIASYTATGIYPSTAFGASLQDVARMVHGNLGSQIFYVETGGFDTHGSQNNTLGVRLPAISQALGAFIDDMKAMNEYANTTLVVFSEFGRRNYENGSLGTDHGHAHHSMVIGGSVTGGLRGANVTNADMLQAYLSSQIDFRQAYHEVIASRLAVDPTPVFPDFTHPGGSLNLFV